MHGYEAKPEPMPLFDRQDIAGIPTPRTDSEDWKVLTVAMQSGLTNYLEHKIMPGDFLAHVLADECHDAYWHADDESKRLLANLIGYLTKHVPSVLRGSPERVRCWLEGVTVV